MWRYIFCLIIIRQLTVLSCPTLEADIKVHEEAVVALDKSLLLYWCIFTAEYEYKYDK